MKSIIFCLLALCLFALECYANCDCDAADNACISKCVVEANGCVTSCKGDIGCYEGCIGDKWPSAAATFKQVLASATPTASGNSASVSATGSHSGSATPSKSSGSATHSNTSMGSTLVSNVAVPLFLVSVSIFYFMSQ